MSHMRGKVLAFDPSVGLGEVEAVDGRVFPFHCIEIADGSRRIEVGTVVGFELIAKMGAYEAADIRPG